jgi:hypothetical protein
VLPGPKVGVLLPLRDDCSYYFSWRHPLPSPCQAIRGISGIPLTPELRTGADVRLIGLWGSTKPHNEPHAIPPCIPTRPTECRRGLAGCTKSNTMAIAFKTKSAYSPDTASTGARPAIARAAAAFRRTSFTIDGELRTG